MIFCEETSRLFRQLLNGYFVYIIELYDGKFYVGSTKRLRRRMKDHFYRTNTKSSWACKKYGPRSLMKIMSVDIKDLELQELIVTKEMMVEFGIVNVYGGPYLTDQDKLPLIVNPRAFDDISDSESDWVKVAQFASLSNGLSAPLSSKLKDDINNGNIDDFLNKYRCKAMGLPKNINRKWNEIDDPVILKLFNKGHGVQEIADIFIRSKATIDRRLTFLGLPKSERDHI